MADEYVPLTALAPNPHWDNHINALGRDIVTAGADRNLGGHYILNCAGILDPDENPLLPTYSVNFDFAPIQPGGTLTGGSPASVTLPNVPIGVNGDDEGHYVYISGGTGTPEAVLLTGGTAVSGGSSQTIEFTPANSHSGAWAISSATGGIQEAIMAGNHHVQLSDAITLHGPVNIPESHPGARYHIKGSASSLLDVAADFPLTVDGVFIAEPVMGPLIESLTLRFIQPDSADLGDYTHWPPAFYMQGVPGFKISDVRVWAAWDGVDARLNAGASVIEGLWMSAFGKGIQIDGALDTIRVNNLHFWPFGLTATQVTVFLQDAGPLGMEVGRMDDLKLTNSLFINQRAIRFWPGGDGFGPGAQLTNCTFDSYAQVKIEMGIIHIANSGFSAAPDSEVDQIDITKGQVNITNTTFFNTSYTARCIHGAFTAQSELQISNCRFRTAVGNVPEPMSIIEVSASAGRSMVLIKGNTFFQLPYLVAAPAIYINNAGAASVTAIIEGNTHNDGVAGAIFAKVEVDDFHRIFGNAMIGTENDLPVTKTLGLYQVSDLELVFPSIMTVTIPGLTP